ncbi:MAG: hypothetical protein FWC95_06450 [Defluviitaleaceae bacterium]|nr:hypothetical protein [Defluviitaleaceae bacterium]
MDIVKQLNSFMLNTKLRLEYAICGGHAIDLFVGTKTRPHKDLDVTLYWDDRDKIIQHMLDSGWDVYEPCGTPYLHKITDTSNQKRVRSNIWCLKPTNRHYEFTEHEKNMYAAEFDNSEQAELDYIEFLFNMRSNGYFLYSRNHEIKIDLTEAIYHADNIPYLAPEIVLLYKSTAADDPDYQLDFNNAVEKMNSRQLIWLKDSLKIMFPDEHIWLDKLDRFLSNL